MYEKIRNIAAALKERFGTADPGELCRCLKIPYIRAELPEGITGLYFERDRRAAIIISDSLAEEQTAACLAHELGHAVLHRGLNTIFISDRTDFVSGRYEREADYFAAALLMPSDDLCETVEDLAAETGLSSLAVSRYLETR